MSPRQLPREDYSWAITLWKAFRDTALVALVGAVGVFFGVMGDLINPEKLAELGVPAYYGLIIVAVFRALQNFLRVRLGWPVVVSFLMLGVLSLGPAAAPVAEAGETLRQVVVEPLISPHLVAFVSVNQNAPEGTSKFAPGITANILGPRLGAIFCNIGGVGVGLETVAPGLEDVSIARASFPILTCAPFGEKIVLQGGIAKPIGGINASDEIPYFGVGVNLATSQAENDVKRAARIKAAKQKALLELQDEALGRPAYARLTE